MAATWVVRRSGSKGVIRPCSRAQIGAAERLVGGQAGEIAEQLAEAAQPAGPRFLRAFPGITPQGRDLVIEQVQARVGEAQQGAAQEAGELDRALRLLEPPQRRGLARRHPPGEMLQAGERQIGEREPIGPQLLEEGDFLGLLLEAPGGFARRHGAQPFEVARGRALDRCQQAWQPAFPFGLCGRGDAQEQDLLVMPARGAHEAPDIPLAEEAVAMLDQPGAGACHEVGLVEHRRRLPAEIGHEPAFGMRGELGAAKRPERRRLMVEQRAAAAIEGADRGDPRWRAGQLMAEMVEHGGRDDLDRVERGAGHLEEADLQRERQPVERPPALTDQDQLVLAQREEMLDLDGRQGCRKPLVAEITLLPAAHAGILGRRIDRPSGDHPPCVPGHQARSSSGQDPFSSWPTRPAAASLRVGAAATIRRSRGREAQKAISPARSR